MDNLKLFNLTNGIEILSSSSKILKNDIINTINKNISKFLNISILTTDIPIFNNDVIDLIAIDDENTPYIVLYQRNNTNIVGKGLLYTDWITLNSQIFTKKLESTINQKSLQKIHWDKLSLICIAGDFNEYDQYTFIRLNRNIKLYRCAKYKDDLILFELLNKPILSTIINDKPKLTQIDLVKAPLKSAIKNDIKESYEVRIGYCNIENSKHYIIDAEGKESEIVNIPNSTYLGEGQFVLVDQYNNFKWAYPYRTDYNDYHKIYSYGVIILKDNKYFIDKGSGIIENINIPNNIQLKERQVVSIDNQNNLLRYYKSIKYSADLFMKSIRSKNQKMLFILKIMSNGCILRDIETGVEFFKVLDINNRKVEEEQVICVNGNEIISIFNSSKIYTLSSFYDKADYGIVKEENNQFFIKKINGELYLLNDYPPFIKDGQTIYIDEFNNFLSVEENECIISHNSKKRYSSNKPLKRLNRTKAMQISKNVTILGNKNFENSYKLGLLKYGYRAEVIEGFEPWSKILNPLKDSDIVIVITNHISHDNMWRVKRDISNIPVIYSEYDGVNRILEQIQNNLTDNVC